MKMIQKAIKKPVEVEVCQWTGKNDKEILDFVGKGNCHFERVIPYYEKEHGGKWDLYIHTLEGNHKALINDYIIKGVHGEFYPCKPDIFEKTYDIFG